jgi:adenine-specific DNA-methyltransferase
MHNTIMKLAVADITFIKELYPRLREDDSAIERYRAAIDRLPAITVARGRVLVDGYHRWKAHEREKCTEIEAEDLGNLTDLEIRKESIRRNSRHGHQLETKDKRKQAGELFLLGVEEDELTEIFSITPKTLEIYLGDAKATLKKRQQEQAWDFWLNCYEPPEIATIMGFAGENSTGDERGNASRTIRRWLDIFLSDSILSNPPDSRQHFDIWNFLTADEDAGTPSFFGKLPSQVIENLLWLYTQPGEIVVDPFVGGGTTIDIAKRMGRRIWASDLTPSTPMLPIHQHDITSGWPEGAPRKANFILLDPPYWLQSKQRYSEHSIDLGNMTREEFNSAWASIIKTCAAHITEDGYLAFIIGPTQLTDGPVIDHAFEMYQTCVDVGFGVERRIIVTYNTQQANGQQVEWAREHRRLLKRYRDLVIFTRNGS